MSKASSSSSVTAETRAAASEIHRGDSAACLSKLKSLLTEMQLPNGLFPLKDAEEVGYVKETGFFWAIQKAKSQHKFEGIGKAVHYDREVTAFVEPKALRKITGVKTKDFVSITISEICVDDLSAGKLSFRSPMGLSKSFPVKAFQVEEVSAANEADMTSMIFGISPAVVTEEGEAVKLSAGVEASEV